jgi:hypothetical protein
VTTGEGNMSRPGQTGGNASLPVPPAAPIMVGNNGTAGGYKFDPGQVRSVINQWKQLRDDLEEDLVHAQTIAGVKPPGVDPASGQFVQGGSNPSGSTLLEQTNQMIQYCNNYIAALEKAAGQIEQAEEDARQAVNQTGGPSL